MKLENIREKKVYIELDKKREIKFDLNAMAEFEETYGEDFFSSADNIRGKKNLNLLKYLLYSALKSEDETVTLKQVGSFIRLKNLAEARNKVIEAINSSMVDPEDDIESESTAVLGPAGKNS